MEERAREYLGLPPAFVVEAEAGARVAAWLSMKAVRESMAGIWPEFEKLLVEGGRSPLGGGVGGQATGDQSAAC